MVTQTRMKYNYQNQNIELIVNFENYQDYKKNNDSINIYDVLIDENIYADSKKGLLISKNLIKEIFQNKSDEEILKQIILNGKIQIPKDFVNKKRDETFIKIVNYISENAYNPQTKIKYTFDLIDQEVKKIPYSINPDINFIHQAEEILSLLKKNIPISIKINNFEIKILSKFIGKIISKIRSFGTIKKEFYDNVGDLRIHIEVNENNSENLIEFLKSNTENTCEYHIKK